PNARRGCFGHRQRLTLFLGLHHRRQDHHRAIPLHAGCREAERMELRGRALSIRLMIDGLVTFHLVEARNPETVCCESALLACALLTVGVPEHPGFAFQIFEEEMSGPDGQPQPVTLWRWVFADK